MKTFVKVALLAALMLIPAAAEMAYGAGFPSAGYRFRCDQKITIDGWVCGGGGYYNLQNISAQQKASTKLEDRMECCVTTFSSGPKDSPTRMLLTRTKPVTRTAKGGVVIEEIVDWIVLERKKGESFESECMLNGKSFHLGVVDEKRKTLIAVTVDENGFQQFSLNWRSFPCSRP